MTEHSLPQGRAPAANQATTDWPVGRRAAWLACTVAFLLTVFDLIDRQMIAAILPFIKADWGLTDTQSGALVSVVSLSIAVLAVPVGIMVDRFGRTKMMGIMGVIWSLATGASALAGNYTHLFACRFFVGAGESAYIPAAQSLMSNIFPTYWRTKIVTLLTNVATSLGVPLGLMLGAFIATHWGWRHAFGVVAVPGLLLAIATFFLHDYRPPEAQTKEIRGHHDSVLKSLPRLFRIPTIISLYFGTTLCYILIGVSMYWYPTYFSRIGGLSVTAASGLTATFNIIGLTYAMMASVVIDRLRKTRRNITPLWLLSCPIVGGAAAISAFGVCTPGSALQIGLVALAVAAMTPVGALTPTIMLDVTPPRIQATGLGVMVTLQNLLGMGAGAFLMGVLSDMFQMETAIIIIACAPLLGIVPYLITLFFYQRDVDTVRNPQ